MLLFVLRWLTICLTWLNWHHDCSIRRNRGGGGLISNRMFKYDLIILILVLVGHYILGLHTPISLYAKKKENKSWNVSITFILIATIQHMGTSYTNWKHFFLMEFYISNIHILPCSCTYFKKNYQKCNSAYIQYSWNHIWNILIGVAFPNFAVQFVLKNITLGAINICD